MLPLAPQAALSHCSLVGRVFPAQAAQAFALRQVVHTTGWSKMLPGQRPPGHRCVSGGSPVALVKRKRSAFVTG